MKNIISKHRHPYERPVLWATIISLVLLIVFSGLASAGIFSLVILFLMTISIIRNRMTMKNYVNTARAITAQSDNHLWGLFCECKKEIPVHEKTSLFLLDSEVLNAWAIGFFNPCQIVITTAIKNNFTDSEIKSIIGHELGHVHFGHTHWALLTGVFEGQNYGIAGLRFLIRFIFLFYSRLCEYSADRAGLLACGNLQDAIRAEIKLNMAGQTPDPELLNKYLNSNTAPDDSLIEDFYELTKTHPTMKGRIQALLKYSRIILHKKQ